MTANFRQRLQNHETLIGTLVSLASPASAELLANLGFDWLFIDAEHAPLALGEIQSILQATQHRCPCLVRIPANDEVFIKQALDMGAAGLIAPLVNTAEAARQIVRLAKYPPAGARSIGLARAHGYGQTFQQYLTAANDELAVVVQIEHIDGVNNVEAILEVEGIDAIFLGPYDLSGSLGKPGEVNDSEVRSAIARVVTACRDKQMPLGIFAVNAKAAQPWVDEGCTLVTVGTDTLFLAEAAKRALKDLGRTDA